MQAALLQFHQKSSNMAVGVEVLMAELLERMEQQAEQPGEEDEGAAEEVDPDLAEQLRS
jgi:hypothetical protein